MLIIILICVSLIREFKIVRMSIDFFSFLPYLLLVMLFACFSIKMFIILNLHGILKI